jgi:hypothetical protein
MSTKSMVMTCQCQSTANSSSLFVSKLLRSKFQVSFQISKRLKKKKFNSDVKPFYFIQSAYTIYLCMSMAIYLSYLSLEVVMLEVMLEVVMLIRITILNRFNRNRNVSITLEETESCSQTDSLNRGRLESDEER